MTDLQSPTIVATRALSDLVNTARDRSAEVRRLGHERLGYGLAALARDLDAVRTRLVEDGDDYLDAAWAFVDAGRKKLAEYEAKLAEAEWFRARA